jgi:hypothetical protein
VLFVSLVLIFIVGDSRPSILRDDVLRFLVYLLNGNDIAVGNQAANILKELSQHGRRWFAFIRVVMTFPVDDSRAAILQPDILSCLHDIFKARNANLKTRQIRTKKIVQAPGKNVQMPPTRRSVPTPKRNVRKAEAAAHVLETLSKYGRRWSVFIWVVLTMFCR